MDATLSRDGTSVSIPMIENSGSPLLAVDYGKPNMDIQKNGALDPRHIDQFSGLTTYSIFGRFNGSNAYDKAITLMDLVKSNSDGQDLILDVPLPELDSNIVVCPAAEQEEAVTVTYSPGWEGRAEVEIQFTQIDSTNGGADQAASTPTATGNGPVQIKFDGETIPLTRDIEVSRSVGRPNSTVKKNTQGIHPNYYDKHKTAHDAFSISLEFGQSTVSKTVGLAEMFKQRLGRQSLTLDFNGLFGMGEFNVIPSGSGALRHTRQSGEEGTVILPTVSLRRVL